ncbi:hypothetical protein D3C81_1125400 [compost metagenome]
MAVVRSAGEFQLAQLGQLHLAQRRERADRQVRSGLDAFGPGRLVVRAVAEQAQAGRRQVQAAEGEHGQARQGPAGDYRVPVQHALAGADRGQQAPPATEPAGQQDGAADRQQRQGQRRQAAQPAAGGAEQQLAVQVAQPLEGGRGGVGAEVLAGRRVDHVDRLLDIAAEGGEEGTVGAAFQTLDVRQVLADALGDDGHAVAGGAQLAELFAQAGAREHQPGGGGNQQQGAQQEADQQVQATVHGRASWGIRSGS